MTAFTKRTSEGTLTGVTTDQIRSHPAYKPAFDEAISWGDTPAKAHENATMEVKAAMVQERTAATPTKASAIPPGLKDPRDIQDVKGNVVMSGGIMFHDPVFTSPSPTLPTGNIGSVQPGSTNYSTAIGPNMGQVNPYTGSVQNGTETYMTGGANLTAQAPKNEEDQGKFGYKVRLFAVRRFPQEYVIFEASPVLSESRTVDYTAVTPVHMPGSIQMYKRTNSRTFSLTAKLISRNQEQATQNMRYLQLLRGWTMPYFGERSAVDDITRADGRVYGGFDPNAPNPVGGNTTSLKPSTGMLGAPPDVLYLYAYSNSTAAHRDRLNKDEGQINIKKLPVVITSLNFDYPDDVDYIPATTTGEPFPSKMDVRIELAETHSPKQYEEFSLSMFKRGQLVHF